MREITQQDCEELYGKFTQYCETAEQHEFPILATVNLRLDATMQFIRENNKMIDQKQARAMFRVVLKVIGEDYSEYEEDNQQQGGNEIE